MIDRFKAYLAENKIQTKKTVLIGTSGGRDSMVLCHLYLLSNLPFAIAHCNFNLRAKESDEDEAFVKRWANDHQIPIHIKSFETKTYAKKRKLSIQMAARELRIKWFKELCTSNNYEFYATAHHSDDAIETYLINQIRGTGLAGLHGILPRQGKLIHPLLFSNREEITLFALSNHISWRDDSSNEETNYLRNNVRHHLLPLLKNINPDIADVLKGNIKRLKAAEDIYTEKIKEYRSQLCTTSENGFNIDFKQLNAIAQKEWVLYEIIKDYGFNFTQASQISATTDTKSGTFVESDTHILLKNRHQLILTEKEAEKNTLWDVHFGVETIAKPISLQIIYYGNKKINKIDESVAQFDFQKLSFPLVLRKWKTGDFFYPLGMKGRKKMLSDFFIDEKLSQIEKKKIWILCSGDQIVWVVGRRIDNRFKITKQTEEVLEVRWLKQTYG
jgi:tRNA(Ile)-lysidine synthase